MGKQVVPLTPCMLLIEFFQSVVLCSGGYTLHSRTLGHSATVMTGVARCLKQISYKKFLLSEAGVGAFVTGDSVFCQGGTV